MSDEYFRFPSYYYRRFISGLSAASLITKWTLLALQQRLRFALQAIAMLACHDMNADTRNATMKNRAGASDTTTIAATISKYPPPMRAYHLLPQQSANSFAT